MNKNVVKKMRKVNSKNDTRNNFKLMKQEKGITLVALVITIIIIIILATVTINMAFGDNGLIRQAELARDLTANSTKHEEDSTANLVAYMNEVMGEDSEIPEPAKTLVQAFNDGEIKVGDYVNYRPEAHEPVTVVTSETGYTNTEGKTDGTDQTFSQNANTTWRVLGLSEDEQHILLISGSPIKKDGDDPYLILESYTGADNCVEVLNKISGLYHNSSLADETRSITIEDIERVVGDMTVEYPAEGEHGTGTVYFSADESKTSIGATTSYPSYTYKEGDYTLTNPPQTATVGEKVTGNGWWFYYTNNDNVTLASYISETIYDLLFKDTTEDANLAKSYWLASPGVTTTSDYASFGPGAVNRGYAQLGSSNLFDSSGDWSAFGVAVRPIVVLKSDITLEQIQVIENQTEETWTTTGGRAYGSGNIG